ncbi:MAG: hypothetical protein Q4B70_02950 [Lachnospiraceae bacterium]|nr:hypothetical protein [Lachnospiraceae bacterium]
MGNYNFEIWQMILLGIIYISYLCWVMFGGMRRKKIKLLVYVLMTVLMIWGLVKEYNGIHSTAEVIDICIILSIGFVKGIYLGRRKIVEQVDGAWYMHHDGRYIIVWFLFFAVKIVAGQILKQVTGVDIPLWHIILYFAFYYPWRTVNVFIANPEMRRDVLKK